MGGGQDLECVAEATDGEEGLYARGVVFFKIALKKQHV